MSMVIFEARGPLAHFRRPDTLGTHATYPFITRTAIRGLAASILGLPSLPAGVLCGLRLRSPVRTVAQELSLHGKSWVSGGAESSFSRPTSIELVVQPHYRIYYQGPLAQELSDRLRAGKSHFHTYLGAAFALTFPTWCSTLETSELAEFRLDSDTAVQCVSVVPTHLVRQLVPAPGDEYARVGGVIYEHLGQRRFRGTISLLYEVNGRPLRFRPTEPAGAVPPYQILQVPGEGVVCLW